MSPFDGIGPLGDAALLVGLCSTRIAVAFLLLPVFSQETMPALVRNALCMALAVLVLALQPAVSPSGWSAWRWLLCFGQEVALGVALGFGVAAFLWAFSAAGQVVDTKVGTANLQVSDPLTGQQVSASGALLGRLAAWLFMAGGGFALFAAALLESFRAWPLGSAGWAPRPGGLGLFEQHFSSMVSLAFLVAAPALVIMFAIDLVLGLVNRFAPQLNLVSVSASLKSLASAAIWMLLLAALAQGFDDALARRLAAMLPDLDRLLGR